MSLNTQVTPTFHEDCIVPRIEDPEWEDYQKCFDAPDDFEPLVNRGAITKLTDEEKDIITDYCAECPVIADCLASSLKYKEDKGIKGGLSQRERRPLHDAFGTSEKSNPIPAAMWNEAIQSARKLREAYVGSPEHKARQHQASEQIIAALRLVPGGLELGADRKTPFHQQLAGKLGLSPVMVRQELAALIESEVVIARTVPSRHNRIAITAIKLREVA